MRSTFATAVALLLLLGVAPAARAQSISPGPLAKPHEKLEGITQCTSCHEVGAGVTDAKCSACHVEIGTRVAAGKGYHAGLSKKGLACATCHQDHAGREFELIAWPGGSPDMFPHAETGLVLEGAHAKVKCDRCHAPEKVRDASLRGRAKTFLGLDAACASCHADAHAGTLPLDCARCHDAHAWTPAKGFDHAKTDFGLQGAHAKVACEKCHEAEGAVAAPPGRAPPKAGPAAPVRPAPGKGGLEPPSRVRVFEVPGKGAQCTTCHEDRHGGRMGQDCKSCHGDQAWKPAAYAPAKHEKLPLVGAHGRADCAKCHGERLDRPLALASCATCHEDRRHKGSLGTRCDACHGVETFQATTYVKADHAKGAFPLAARHAEASCESCHVAKVPPLAAAPGSPARAEATKPPAACASCHKDTHEARLGADCASCHDAKAWGPVAAFDAAAHARTRYKLDGEHATLACDRCHGRAAAPVAAAPAARGATSTAVPAKGAPARLAVLAPISHDRCASCHADAHKGELARRPDGGSCEACHDTGGFRPARFDAAAHARTPFALKGAHAAVRCDKCHGGPGFVSAAPAKTTAGAPAAAQAPGTTVKAAFSRVEQVAVVRLHPPSGRCGDCHADPHRGQFGAGADAARCDACHTDQTFRPPLPFDHAKTRFSLSGKHASLECARCHTPPPPGGRAPPALATCATCHRDPHLMQFSRRGDPDPLGCGDCHGDRSFRPADRFDHAEHTRFPLDGKHAATACERCHPTVELAPGLSTRLYRPVPLECAGCHEGAHDGKPWADEPAPPPTEAPAAPAPAPGERRKP